MALADLNNVLKYFSQSTPDDEAQEALYAEILLMTLARASSSDTNVDLDEIETIKEIVKRETGEDVSSEDVRRAARSELYETVSLRKYLRSVGRQLSSEHRAKIARALADVIRSDTTINVLEIDFFNRVADALRVTPAELVGLSVR
jgi:uncharacterized tellurite resistance protein B-like protein